MARSRGAHSIAICTIFPMLAGGSVSPASPVLVCYRKKEGYESGKVCAAEFHTAVGYSWLFFLVRLNEAFQNAISCLAR